MSGPLYIPQRSEQKRGREARSQSLSTRFTKAEQAVLTHAAETSGKTLREWSREVLLRDAKRSDNAIFTEIIATRMLLNSLLQLLASDQKITADNLPEMLAYVRREKHQAAREVMAQYTASEKGERDVDPMGA